MLREIANEQIWDLNFITDIKKFLRKFKYKKIEFENHSLCCNPFCRTGKGEKRFMTPNEIYMNYAFKEAEKAFDSGEVPVGCVIVFQNTIIAKAYNMVESLKDPTAHAEILAITSAAEYLQSKQLVGCSMYVTLEPCSMCAGAIVLSKIENIFFGAFDIKSGACGSVLNITNSKSLNHKSSVTGGVLDMKCREILKSFFEVRRD